MVASKTHSPAERGTEGASLSAPGSALGQAVAQALAPDGLLARAWPGWRPRAAQSAMAQAVAEALDGGEALLVEAPAGSGKTIAYLLPSLLSGRRALISTSTHVLQRQLADRDLPRLAAALGLPLNLAVLKGRGRYVCLARLQAAVADGPRVGAAAEHRWLRELLAWAEADPEGDLDRVAGVDTVASLHGRISSTHDNCSGMACARWGDCRVERARRAAQRAQVLVVNHHVWLADLQRSARGRPGLLPTVDLVVFDEAHALHALRARLGAEVLDRAALQVFWNDIAALGEGPLKGLQPWGLFAHDGLAATRALDQALLASALREGRQPWPLQDLAPSWRLANALASVRQALLACRGAEPRAARLWERTQGPAQVLHTLLGASGQGPASDTAPAAVWLDWASREAWSAVRPALRDEAVLAQALATAAPLGAACVVHTSATLGQSEELSWHREALALGTPWSPRTLRLSEPGDPQAAGLFVPPDLPEPGESGHAEALADLIVPWIQALGGRCLVLATTRRAAQRLAQGLQGRARPGWRVLLVGERPTPAVLEALRRADGREPVIVVASGALWQGIDVPGEALQLLVIDKLPFAPPDDPWLQRRLARAQALGQDGFQSVQLADAAMALRQGVGRLIRRAGDRGLVVIGDARLRRRAYAPALLAALPASRWLDTVQEVDDWVAALAALTTASTSGRAAS